MNDKTLLDVIPKSLDLLTSTVYILVPLALLVLWAALTRQEIKIGNVTLKVSNAYLPVLWIFVIANLAIIFNLVQLGSALQQLSAASLEEGIARVWYHSSPINPFCQLGNSAVEKTVSFAGYGVLILAWWICFLATSSLLTFERIARRRLFLLVPIATGIASLAAVSRVFRIIIDRAVEVPKFSVDSFRTSLGGRQTIAVLAIVLGILLYVLIQNRILKHEKLQRLSLPAIAKLAAVGGTSLSGPFLTLIGNSILFGVFSLALIPWLRFFYAQRYWLMAIVGFSIFGFYFIMERPISVTLYDGLYAELRKENYLDEDEPIIVPPKRTDAAPGDPFDANKDT